MSGWEDEWVGEWVGELEGGNGGGTKVASGREGRGGARRSDKCRLWRTQKPPTQEGRSPNIRRNCKLAMVDPRVAVADPRFVVPVADPRF